MKLDTGVLGSPAQMTFRERPREDGAQADLQTRRNICGTQDECERRQWEGISFNTGLKQWTLLPVSQYFFILLASKEGEGVCQVCLARGKDSFIWRAERASLRVCGSDSLMWLNSESFSGALIFTL